MNLEENLPRKMGKQNKTWWVPEMEKPEWERPRALVLQQPRLHPGLHSPAAAGAVLTSSFWLLPWRADEMVRTGECRLVGSYHVDKTEWQCGLG